MLTSLGKFLRMFRIQHGELLKDMADKLDVAPAYLSAIENGKRVPNKKLLNNIINSYNISGDTLDELLAAYSETLDEVTLDIRNSSVHQRNLCISFARRFNGLDDFQIEQIRKILEDTNA